MVNSSLHLDNFSPTKFECGQNKYALRVRFAAATIQISERREWEKIITAEYVTVTARNFQNIIGATAKGLIQ